MRPQSIVHFERVVLFSLLLGVANTFMIWGTLTSSVATAGMGVGFIVTVQAITLAIYLLLIWFIARKGSPVAKWIYVVLAAIGLLFGLIGIGQVAGLYGTSALVITIVQYVLSAVSIWLLFRPDANAWFSNGRGPVDPSIFN